MASTMKLKFAGFMRGLLRLDDSGSARHVAPPSPAAPEPPQVPTEQSDENKNTRASVESQPVAGASDTLEIPLAPVIACLPMDLKAKLMAAPPAGQTITLSADAIVNQLAFGAVKIAFGELRRLAPGGFANFGG